MPPACAVDVDGIVALIARRAREVDVLLVEGAGGLLVPIAGDLTYLDLAVRARLPLLVVAANRLGTVNHTALTARVATAAGLDVRGFVLSQPTPSTDVSAASNADTIARLTGLPCLGVLPHAERPGLTAHLLVIPS
ncbi:MAG TPA: ATP-dependent dethiobiotin synthetase BioD [Candidatus Eisenbacteria bacterium]|nr:ATP-dependent dethiobiotin synthetase BioD [Candidatus Eisenbacteria bacterium]